MERDYSPDSIENKKKRKGLRRNLERVFVLLMLQVGLDPLILLLIFKFKFKFIDFEKTKFKFIDFAKVHYSNSNVTRERIQM